MRVAKLLAEAAATGESIDRSGDGRFVEVYPAAALHVWGFPSRGYKGAKGATVRGQMVSDLAERTADWLILSEEDWTRCTASDDMLDALVAALVARAVAFTGRCEPIPPNDLELAAEEGWIALRQPRSLDRLD